MSMINLYHPHLTLVEVLNTVSDVECDLMFIGEELWLRDFEEDCYGVTIMPEDEFEIPLIVIRGSLSVIDSLEIMAHEFAHVCVGIEHDHNEVFQAKFDEIHALYEATCKGE